MLMARFIHADFDPTTIDDWAAEGFSVQYLRYNGDAKAYHKQLKSIGDSLGLGDKFAICGT